MSNFNTAVRALWQMRIRKRPFVLSHGINSTCNMQCSFCDYWREEKQEMTVEEIFSMLDDAKDFGIGVYNAWTVEPLMRSELPEILEYAHSLELKTSLVTNGLLLKKRISELTDLDYLSVSVDGIETYRDSRGVDFSRILPGIEEAVSTFEKHVLLNCVISNRNIHELRDLVLLADDLGAMISFEPMYEFSSIEDNVWDKIGVRDKNQHRMAVDDLIHMKEAGYPIINSKTYLQMVRDMRPKWKCHAPNILIGVSQEGMVYTCRVHREPLADIRDGLENVWKQWGKQMQEKASSCEGCLFFGYAENSMMYRFNPEVIRHYEWM
ncbi:MoaA/NifB/PqqE/SkfB family radical SAM enzyme [Methanohalophilus levihalophilus]|uniref:radical SAM protein n=1 Tax=Methanohalophilus levihalophilus TaxID=1431282 RepID=UPI001AE1A882|nr:radical SAM protein [Methanohalophilus levihalophilus]MBP2030045.1 MoaA/NifB/PqqE/SkfB family radical SAM enzyme [Methanohalophilus levihalophilus]